MVITVSHMSNTIPGMRFAVLLVMVGCAHAPLVEPEPAAHPPPKPAGERIAQAADALVGLQSLKVLTHLPDDCTGLVRYAYSMEGVDLMPAWAPRGSNGVTAIWFAAKERGALHRAEPKPGDLVFFRETYDRDRDGRRDDGLTHVGVVDFVESDGTVDFVHRVGRGVERGRLNVKHPLDHAMNDWLRTRSRTAPAALTGELFVGYASASAMAAPRDSQRAAASR
jgi:hypothetical protein